MQPQYTDLTGLRNIGVTIARRLIEVGIPDAATLRAVGAVEAFKRVRASQPFVTTPVCYYLYALQGALMNTHWNDLPGEMKQMLREQAGIEPAPRSQPSPAVATPVAPPQWFSSTVLPALNQDLQQNIDPTYCLRLQDHFKLDVSNVWGVRAPVLRGIAHRYYPWIEKLDIDQQFAVCDTLLATFVYEHKAIALQWSYRCHDQHRPHHFSILERWLFKYIDDWVDCDEFCTRTLGTFLLHHPELANRLRDWTAAENRWARRAAAVALIPLLRDGQCLNFAVVIADALSADEDDMVRKGLGWMLKEAGRRFPSEVFQFIMQRQHRLPRVTIRLAAETLTSEQRSQLVQRRSRA